MITQHNIETLELTQKCDRCGAVNKHTLEVAPLIKMEDFNEYKNHQLDPCKCGTVEVLNMNLPENEEDIKHLMSEEEWQVRCFLRAFIQACKDLPPPTQESEKLSWDDILK